MLCNDEQKQDSKKNHHKQTGHIWETKSFLEQELQKNTIVCIRETDIPRMYVDLGS